jgi:uncharacterized protein YrrD
MLKNVKKLNGYHIKATDGKFGKVDDFLFDDMSWTIRYLVADTGRWLPGRKVLLSPLSLGKLDQEENVFPVELTKEQIEDSPPIEKDEPVSRRQEERLSAYYNLMPYWAGGVMGGVYIAPTNVGTSIHLDKTKSGVPEESNETRGDPNLRNCREVMSYRIDAKDGSIGHVEDFIIDDESWIIRYLVVDTGKWLDDQKFLTAVSWIKEVDWGEAAVTVDLTKEQIKDGPKYDPSSPIKRKYEDELHEHFGRSKYWD